MSLTTEPASVRPLTGMRANSRTGPNPPFRTSSLSCPTTETCHPRRWPRPPPVLGRAPHPHVLLPRLPPTPQLHSGVTPPEASHTLRGPPTPAVLYANFFSDGIAPIVMKPFPLDCWFCSSFCHQRVARAWHIVEAQRVYGASMDCRAPARFDLSLPVTGLPLSLPEELRQALRVHVWHQAPDLPLTLFSILAWVLRSHLPSLTLFLPSWPMPSTSTSWAH